MFKFRGKSKYTNKYAVGYYRYNRITDTHFIFDLVTQTDYDIIPETLSVSTGKLDSNDQEIFASFPIDGVMTTGGDVVRIKGIYNRYDYSVYYKADACTFCLKCKEGGQSEIGAIQSNELTIIGKQGGESECN